MSRRATGDRPLRPRRSEALPRIRSTRGFGAFLCAALILCAVLKIPSLRYPQTEMDERIYWQLAENLAQRGEYTLQGTELLKSLSANIYDRPLFNHPPLFSVLLIPFVLTGMKGEAVLVSWVGHFLVVLAVALVGRHMLLRQSASTVESPSFWLPILAVSSDPVLLFVSRRIWIDSLLSGLVALAMVTVSIAEGNRRRMMLAIAGVLLGLAALAKLTALILLPVFFFAAVRGDVTWKERAASAAVVFLPVCLIVMPWLVLFYARYGVVIPDWVKPDAKLMELYPFVRVAVERPWYYYLLKLGLIVPLTFVAFWPLVSERATWRLRPVQIAGAWFCVFLVTLTFMGVDGYGFQMRHIAPAVAAVYVVLIVVLLERERPLLLMTAAFAMVIGAVTGAMYLLVPEFDEIVSLARIAGFGNF